MPKLIAAPNIAIATLWVDVLAEAGVAASVQRYFMSGLAGEMPPDQCQPEVWLVHAEQEPQARALLDALANLPQRNWACACGEQVEGGFETCWQCGSAMPA